MIQIVGKEQYAGMALTVAGAEARITTRIFEVDCPELEEWLSGANQFLHRFVVGVAVSREEQECE